MRKILWLIPPLLGVAFYVGGSVVAERAAAAAAEKDAAARGLARREAADASLPRTDGMKVDQLNELMNAAAEKEAGGIGTADAARLREMILEIKKRWDAKQDRAGLSGYLQAACTRLGKLDGAAALTWGLANVPERKQAVMTGWAEADPEGAFEAIVHSDITELCTWHTLMKILEGFGRKSPVQMLEASRRVPLELYSRRGEDMLDQVPRLNPQDEATRRLWAESGAALELEAQGIDISSVTAPWVKADPRRALEQWQAGEGLGAGDPQRALLRLVDAAREASSDLTTFDQLKEEVSRSSPEVRARISGLLADHVLKEGVRPDSARRYYGNLIQGGEEKEKGDGQ